MLAYSDRILTCAVKAQHVHVIRGELVLREATVQVRLTCVANEPIRDPLELIYGAQLRILGVIGLGASVGANPRY